MTSKKLKCLQFYRINDMLHFNSILEVEKEVLVLENVAERNYKQTLIYILHIKNRATQAHK